MARRLRIPKALAVALLGSASTVAVSFGGCDVPTKMPRSEDPSAVIPDAGSVDGDTLDSDVADAMVDAMIDARPDAAIDARPDAAPDAAPDAPIV